MKIMTEQQISIYNGLQKIGPEIAAFYIDGLKIINDNTLQTKAYLLGHLMREIDCGLRDVFCGKNIIEKVKKDNAIKEKHKYVIALALDQPEINLLVKEWYKVSKEFHKLAHRHGVTKNPKDKNICDMVWQKYEKILIALIGNYYNMMNRLDKILNQEEPHKELLDFLPNLLREKSYSQYFFTNLKSIKWFDPLIDSGFFNPENSPEPYFDEENQSFRFFYWDALFYLENVAKINSETITTKILRIIDSIITYKNSENKRNENYLTDWMIIKIIELLPIEKINLYHIDFFYVALNGRFDPSIAAIEICKSIIPKFIKSDDKSKALKLFEIIFDYKIIKNNELDSLIGNYRLGEIIENKFEVIFDLLGYDIIEIILNKIQALIAIDERFFSDNSIEFYADDQREELHYKHEDYDVLIIEILKKCILSSKPDKIIGLIDKMLCDENAIFKRTALFAIDYHYDYFKEIFWKWLSEYGKNIEYSLKDELYNLFKNNCLKFTENEIDSFSDWVEKHSYYINPEHKYSDDEQSKILAFYKKEWLTALKESKNEKIINSYSHYNKINPSEVTYSGKTIRTFTWTGGGASPIMPEMIAMMDNKQICDYLNQVKLPKISHWPDKPSKEGLSDALRDSVAENINKIISNYKPFLSIKSVYLNSILVGIREGLKKNVRANCVQIIEFIKNIINSNEIFGNSFKENEHEYSLNYTIERITDIFKELLNKKLLIERNLCIEIVELLILLYDKIDLKYENYSENPDLAFNTADGRLINTIFEYLRFEHLNFNSSELWKLKIKNFINEKLLVQNISKTLFLIGNDLVLFYKIDFDWLNKLRDSLLNSSDNAHWHCFFEGFLFGEKPHKELYFFLKKDYLKAIPLFIEKSHVKRLTQHICLYFINNIDSLLDSYSLTSNLINNNNPDQIFEVIHYISNISKRSNLANIIKPLWSKLLTLINSIPSSELFKTMHSYLCLWVSLLDELDDEAYNLIIESVKYLKVGFNKHRLVDILYTHIEKTPAKVGQILLESVKIDSAPSYSENEEKIVIKLFECGETEIASEICNLYGENNYHFLKKIYESYCLWKVIPSAKTTNQ
ncbi:MAG: hypothetical protein BWY32_00573 [bacterium ADurb.Bin243]|nr:MAG: hypothetical protein BWY32_00573 [bacterium ADurb.Bin243]